MDNPETLAAFGQQDTGHRTKTNKPKRNKINKEKYIYLYNWKKKIHA
jgi:hypothetical protein